MSGSLFETQCSYRPNSVVFSSTQCQATTVDFFLPRDATQSAVMPHYIVCLSVRLSVRNV